MKKYIISVFILFFILIIFNTSCEKILKNKENINYNEDSEETTSNIQTEINISDLQKQLHNIAKQTTPAVVFISTEKIITQKYVDPFDFFSDPREKLYKEKEFKQTGLGSGVIYKKKKNSYYIITNNHVIEGADSIEITIDQTKIYKGTIIGSDPQVDIAVVKIDTKDKLTVAKFGNSNSIKVGDFVVAIGNPFGLSGSMTFGIISAIGRSNLNTDRISLTDFIQTDAAINPGNSGGPLINIGGEVIGINTLIYSQSGGNVGIGFAVPVNILKNTADKLIEKGKVEHGFLGVFYKELTSEDINVLGIKGISKGMLITEVIENSPAQKAGLQSGDVIVEVNNKKLKTRNDLAIIIGNSNPEEKVNIKIIRNNTPLNVSVVLGIRESETITKTSESSLLEKYGMEVAKLTDEAITKLNIPKDKIGVIVTKIYPNSISKNSGIMEGDIIYKINQTKITKVENIKKEISKNNKNYFFIYRKGKDLIINM